MLHLHIRINARSLSRLNWLSLIGYLCEFIESRLFILDRRHVLAYTPRDSSFQEWLMLKTGKYYMHLP